MGNIGRRGFLGLLGSAVAATAAALELDPERALWVPGRKTIFLPPKDVRLATKAETELYQDPGPWRLDHRYRLDVVSNVLSGLQTSLYFDERWRLVRAFRHVRDLDRPFDRVRQEPVTLTPESLHILEAELGQKLSEFARLGVEHKHGLNHHELQDVAERTRFYPLRGGGAEASANMVESHRKRAALQGPLREPRVAGDIITTRGWAGHPAVRRDVVTETKPVSSFALTLPRRTVRVANLETHDEIVLSKP